ncbi:hypothetical protein [Aestuariivivens insulae]|uniref:hypothetical protein n=1 Tax=Aestuariivivens insulae TaxID=1621988 RepID=UPI001F59E219|nr:hypothetical protein [Aestuariivivens insulae]
MGILFKFSALVLIMCLNLGLYAQGFNGTYVSQRASYTDHANPNEDFTESTKFNIAIAIDGEKGVGDIIVQDPRIPNKILAYRVVEPVETIEKDNIQYHIYQCLAEHLDGQAREKVTFYKKQGKLNLMVSSKGSSQLFFDLVKQ